MVTVQRPTPAQPVRFLITPAGSFRLESLPDGRVRVTPPDRVPEEQQQLALRVIVGLGNGYRVVSEDGSYLLSPLPGEAAAARVDV